MPSFTHSRIPPLHDPSNPIGAALSTLRDEGLPVAHVIYVEDTGQVLMADEDGRYRPAHGAIREMVTGEPWRDPGPLNPVPSYAVRRSPRRLEKHNAEVADMLLYLVRFYWPVLAADPETKVAIAHFLPELDTPDNRRKLVGLSDNYERWNVIASNFVRWIGYEEEEATE